MQKKTKKFKNNIHGFTKKAVENIIMVKAVQDKKEFNEAPYPVDISRYIQDHEMLEVEQGLCQNKHCGAGRICKLNEADETKCVCISDCPIETDDRRKVCSNYNETWGSDCEIHRMRCNCEENTEKCKNPEFAHLHVEYYGVCKQLAKCSDSEMADFPRRMTQWLFQIMHDIALKEEISPYFTTMIEDAETDMTKRWSNAAVWKWCDLEYLDGHPHDKAVSRHELFPIRAPLMYLEHCIAPFLNKCDADNDHMVTLKEWSNCLEIPYEDLEEQCDDLRNEL